jgi:predicted phage terminase large subunit-like protein
MTRWHEDDLAGRLLKDMQEGGDKWEIVNLPALAEAMDPLGREPGEPLWPQWEDAGALARKRRAVGEREWSALYQQRPTSDEGSILKRDWWLPWTDPVPRNPDMVLISIDTAFTEKDENDPSGCTVWNIVADPANIFRSKILLRYAWRERLTFPDLVSHLIDTATHFRIPGVPLRVLVEAKGPGLSVIQELRRRVPDLGVYQYVPKSDKVARAHSVTAMLEGGHVFGLARMEGEPPKSVFRPTVQMVIDESASFPVGFHDDLTDTVTQALRHIRDLGVELFSEDEPPADDYTQTEALY